jgi:hypothetical protein
VTRIQRATELGDALTAFAVVHTEAVFEGTACNHVDNAPAALSRYPHDCRHSSNKKVLTNVE